MPGQNSGPAKWLDDCASQVYDLACTDQARKKFAERIRQWADDNVRRCEWVGSGSPPKAPPNEEERAKLYGPPPLCLGPELTLPGKYVISALVHDFCIDEVRERAAKYVLLLDPWAEAEERPQNEKYAEALERADQAEEKLREAVEAGKSKKAVAAAKRAYDDAVKGLQTARDDSAPEVTEDRSFATYQVLRHYCMNLVEEKHQHFIREAIDAVGSDLQKSVGGVKSKEGKREPCLWLGQALLLVRDHPDWSAAKIAHTVGVHPSQLTPKRCPEFQIVAEYARGSKADRPRGYVEVDPETGSRDLEAYSGQDDPAKMDRDDP